MNGSRIAAVGHYQPAKVLTNEDLAGLVDTSDEWIRSRVGIRTRHIAGPDEPVDELAAHAAAKALAAAGLTPADIDMVLVATSTAVDRSPNMAARAAARLGIPQAATMDLNVVCAGFTHALATADHAVRAGGASRVLVIGADKMSEVTDWSDRTTCVLVGDGAGAGFRAGAVGFGAREGQRGAQRGHPAALRPGRAERVPLGHHTAAAHRAQGL